MQRVEEVPSALFGLPVTLDEKDRPLLCAAIRAGCTHFATGDRRDFGHLFGKTVEHNLELHRRLGELRDLGRPIVFGSSRKSFIGKLTGAEVDERVGGTIASNVIAYANGADVLRVHDVAATRDRGVRTLGWAFALLLAMIAQIALGVFTLIYHVPLWLALVHQAGALVVLTIAVLHAERLTPRRVRISDSSAKAALDPTQA